MKITIIVPSLQDEKSWKYNKFCIDSIKRTSKIEHDIILATNNGEEIVLPEGFNGIKRIHNVSQGQCGAVNRAVDFVETEWMMIIDNDMVFSQNWESILDKLDDKEFLCGNLVEPGTRGSSFITYNCGETPEVFDVDKFEKFVIEKKRDEITQGFGFPLFIKKELWQKIGGYREELDPWSSNADSFLEYFLVLHGTKLLQYQGSLFYHFQCMSGTFTLKEAEPFWTKNTNYFPQFFGFGRVRAPRIWSSEFIIPKNKLIFLPDWADLSENNEYIKPDELWNEAKECSQCRYEYLKWKYNNCPKCNK